MATVKFYKKFSPRTQVIINDGKDSVEFDSLDAVLGYYATQDEGVQAQFLGFMKAQRYGISEISAEEFNREYVEKKRELNGSQARPWREEIQSRFRLTGQEQLAEETKAALAVSGKSDIRRSGAVMEPAIRMEDPGAPQATAAATREAEKKPYVPTLGKRKLKS